MVKKSFVQPRSPLIRILYNLDLAPLAMAYIKRKNKVQTGICIRTCIHVCADLHTYAGMFLEHVYMYKHRSMRVHISTHIYTHTCRQTDSQTDRQTDIHTFVYMYRQINTRAYTCSHDVSPHMMNTQISMCG